MTDKRWAKLTGTKAINRAAQRRANDEERAQLIEWLGMPPEKAGDRYAASTGELRLWANEKAALRASLTGVR